MGCWNKTCALSNLHIHAGEPVYVFIIEQNPLEDHCYSTHLYSPILLPFYSHYDDYGAGENSSGVGLSVIIEALKKLLVEKEVGKNEYHDIAVKRENFDENLLFTSIRENRLYVPNHYSQYPNQPEENAIEFVMMRKDVVDKILDEYEIEAYESVEGKINCVKYKFSDIVKDVDFMIDHIKGLYKEHKSQYFTLFYISSVLATKNSRMKDWIPYFDSFALGGISSIISVLDEVSNFVKADKCESAKELLTDALKGAFIARFMEYTRRSWIPQSGEGSQNIDLDGHKLLAKTVLELVKKEELEKEEWG